MEKGRDKGTAILVCLLILLLSSNAACGIAEDELDAAMSALRSAGYNLFPNAIDTTDLRYRLLTAGPNSSFTLFSPPDPFVFTLDFTSPSAEHYFLALLRHVSPLGLSSSELLGLARRAGPNGPRLIPTLMTNHSLQLNLAPDSVVTVSGVRISSPDLYLGQDLAVHGLNRTLMEFSSTIPKEYYAYTGWGLAPSPSPGMVPDLDLTEAAPPHVQHRGSQSHGNSHRGRSRRTTRKRRNRHGGDDNNARSHVLKK